MLRPLRGTCDGLVMVALLDAIFGRGWKSTPRGVGIPGESLEFPYMGHAPYRPPGHGHVGLAEVRATPREPGTVCRSQTTHGPGNLDMAEISETHGCETKLTIWRILLFYVKFCLFILFLI